MARPQPSAPAPRRRPLQRPVLLLLLVLAADATHAASTSGSDGLDRALYDGPADVSQLWWVRGCGRY